MNIGSPDGWGVVYGPSFSARFLTSRIFPDVPRIIASWWPRRAPYELNCSGLAPCSCSHVPAGLHAGIVPAGEMWSVVTESPRTAKARAPTTSVTSAGSGDRPSKNGGKATYVEPVSHA